MKWFIGGLAQAVLIWIWFVLHGRRLRDGGQAATLAAGVGILYALGVILLLLIGSSFLDKGPIEAWGASASGALGLLWAAVAARHGMEVFVAGRRPERTALAAAYGARYVDLGREGTGALVARDGAPPDIAVDCPGDRLVWERLAGLVRPGGQVLLFGGCAPGTLVGFDAARLHYAEITLTGCFHYTPDEARALAIEGAARLRDWARLQPVVSRNLFALGVAARPGDKPTYFYALFRSADGNLRAYVRAGGPAYAAGLRSGDVVDTIDGLPWWRLGTYQSERRAYDGKPHAFEVLRNGRSVEIRFGAPFTA